MDPNDGAVSEAMADRDVARTFSEEQVRQMLANGKTLATMTRLADIRIRQALGSLGHDEAMQLILEGPAA